MPEVLGASVRAAALALHRRGFRVELRGSGRVARTSPRRRAAGGGGLDGTRLGRPVSLTWNELAAVLRRADLFVGAAGAPAALTGITSDSRSTATGQRVRRRAWLAG